MDALKDLLTNEFKFETHEFKISSRASFASAVKKFMDIYHGPTNLAIIYYAGHGYIKRETGLFELNL